MSLHNCQNEGSSINNFVCEMYKHNGNGILHKNIYLPVLLSVAGGAQGASIINFCWLLWGLGKTRRNFNFLLKKLFVDADSLGMYLTSSVCFALYNSLPDFLVFIVVVWDNEQLSFSLYWKYGTLLCRRISRAQARGGGSPAGSPALGLSGVTVSLEMTEIGLEEKLQKFSEFWCHKWCI